MDSKGKLVDLMKKIVFIAFLKTIKLIVFPTFSSAY